MDRLNSQLTKQIADNNLKDKVEILIFKDKKGENSIGSKRNKLLSDCQGEYSVFIDCDDRIHDDYLKLIIDKLETEQPDVVKLEGIITVNGADPKKFIHSIEFEKWYEKNNIYYRNPNHLNPIKSSIAKQFKFKDISFGEDRDWSEQLSKAKVLKKESTTNETLYYYDYITNKK